MSNIYKIYFNVGKISKNQIIDNKTHIKIYKSIIKKNKKPNLKEFRLINHKI